MVSVAWLLLKMKTKTCYETHQDCNGSSCKHEAANIAKAAAVMTPLYVQLHGMTARQAFRRAASGIRFQLAHAYATQANEVRG